MTRTKAQCERAVRYGFEGLTKGLDGFLGLVALRTVAQSLHLDELENEIDAAVKAALKEY